MINPFNIFSGIDQLRTLSLKKAKDILMDQSAKDVCIDLPAKDVTVPLIDQLIMLSLIDQLNSKYVLIVRSA